mmetsp:Transcript_24279/g.61131  ORF Transcript_24279/g.61131 Transcript_24279/m.61131 type:complete len:244 (+) Transcript_24279:3872-4603(+)
MRKYLTMLMTHPHMPAAADDLDFITSGVKVSPLAPERRFFSIHSHAITGVLSLSKAMRALRNWSTLPISFLAAPHDTSLGILPPPMSTSTPAVTSSTPAGGEARALSSVIDFLSSELRASTAAWMTGSAAAISFSHSAWKAMTSCAIASHFCSSTEAPAFCSSAMLVSCPTTTRSLSVASFFSSTMAMSLTRFSCSSATCSAAEFIFSSPLVRRSLSCWMASFLDASIVLYRSMRSRYDLGVV